MIENHISSAYSSPLSHQRLIEQAQLIEQRISMTQHAIESFEEKVNKTLPPEVVEFFDQEVKTLIDLYA